MWFFGNIIYEICQYKNENKFGHKSMYTIFH